MAEQCSLACTHGVCAMYGVENASSTANQRVCLPMCKCSSCSGRGPKFCVKSSPTRSDFRDSGRAPNGQSNWRPTLSAIKVSGNTCNGCLYLSPSFRTRNELGSGSSASWRFLLNAGVAAQVASHLEMLCCDRAALGV
eukprot:1506-Heterococcus_DN1.PRE.2